MTKKYNLFHTLTLLTCLGIFTQLMFLWANYRLNHVFDAVFSASLSQQMFHSKITLIPLLHFIIIQVLIYSVYTALIAYMAVSVGVLLMFSQQYTYRLGILLWFTSTTAVIAANCYYAQYSYFSILIRHELFQDGLSDNFFLCTLIICAMILAVAICLSVVNLIFDLYRQRNVFRQTTVFFLFLMLCGAELYQDKMNSPAIYSAATTNKPNIFIIGLDALRPDFVSSANTPTINQFLQSAAVFSDTYTPLARTFPSWTSILTAKHPLHSHARGNIPELASIDLDETLAKRLQQVGYETIYATDDNRFNNVNQQFGFDEVVGPPMGVNDFFLGSLNDFPLTNLLISTGIGKVLFPYSFGNRAAAISYDPNNFQQLLQAQLHQRNDKPLFLAVHFCVSGWPFYRIGSKHYKTEMDVPLYQNAVATADQQLQEFLALLQQSGLLNHAVVVLLSDHGITLGLHGDRVVSANLYQGDKKNINKIIRANYSDLSGSGIDTSYGYGGDIMSLKQTHALLAFKGYGVKIENPHIIKDRTSLLDVTPTLLDILQLAPLGQGDGISLKPYLLQTDFASAKEREFFLETSFTIPEIEKEGISPDKVLEKTIQLYQVDPQSGLVSVRPKAEQTMIGSKERAILAGDWLLVSMPSFSEAKLIGPINGNMILRSYPTPPFKVLINIKTGQWTTELNDKFAAHAPVKKLSQSLRKFYGNEAA